MYNELNIEYFYPTVAELPVTAFLILFIFYHVNPSNNGEQQLTGCSSPPLRIYSQYHNVVTTFALESKTCFRNRNIFAPKCSIYESRIS